MHKKIQGIVDRCAPDMVGHGDHGLNLILQESTEIFWLPGAREAYATVYERPSASNSVLVSLTRPGDHVRFEAQGSRVKAGSFRNWTLEQRLLGSPAHDITPKESPVSLRAAPPLLLDPDNG